MKYEDLPPALQAQVDSKLGAPPRSARKRSAPTAGVDAYCAACGAHVGSERAMSDHRDATGHGRYELLAPYQSGGDE